MITCRSGGIDSDDLGTGSGKGYIKFCKELIVGSVRQDAGELLCDADDALALRDVGWKSLEANSNGKSVSLSGGGQWTPTAESGGASGGLGVGAAESRECEQLLSRCTVVWLFAISRATGYWIWITLQAPSCQSRPQSADYNYGENRAGCRGVLIDCITL